VGAYSSPQAWVFNSSFQNADSDGVIFHTTVGIVRDCIFDNLTTDIKAVHADIRVQRTQHYAAYDEALWMYHSDFDISEVTTEDSYWGLRAFKSSGVCQGLSTMNATIGVQLERSSDVTLINITIDGGTGESSKTSRGLFVTGGPFTFTDSTITNVRTGIDLTSAVCTIERVTIRNCTREGVIVGLSWTFTLRDVTVTNASDGFRMNLYSGGRIETAGATTTTVDSNTSMNRLGMNILYSRPTLRNCTFYQGDENGVLVNDTIGLLSLYSSPLVQDGIVIGGYGGFRLNGSRSHVRDVTFVNVDMWGVQVRHSYADVVENCEIFDSPNATAIVVYEASCTLRGNDIHDVNYGITTSTGSEVAIEYNTITNITWDGIWVVDNTTATLRGNTIKGCYYSVLILYNGRVVSTNDVMMDSTDIHIVVWSGSSLDMRGGHLENASLGVNAFDSPFVSISFSEFRNLNRGIVITKSLRSDAVAPIVEGFVQGCYFTNHSAYGVGMFGGFLTVDDCNFLDNIAAVQVANATVTIRDSTMVGSWLFGLMAEDSSVEWIVENRCRIVSSDISGNIQWRVSDAVFQLEESDVTLTSSSSFEVTEGSDVRIRNVKWMATGSTLRIDGSQVKILDTLFDGVGPIVGGEWTKKGVAISRSEVLVRNSTFLRARAGLSLDGCTVLVEDSRFSECSNHGIGLVASQAEVYSSTIERTVLGYGIHSVDTDLHVEDTTIAFAIQTLRVFFGNARLVNCSMGGAEEAAVFSSDGKVVLVNTTHEPAMILEGDDPSIEVWWFVTAKVIWPNPTELVQARVWIDNVSGTEVAAGRPDPGGTLRNMHVRSLIYRGSRTDVMGPFYVAVELEGYSAGSSVEVDTSIVVWLNLEDHDPPRFVVQSPTADEIWTRNRTVEVFGQAIDDGSGTSRVEGRLDFGPSVWTSKGSVFAFTFTMSDGRHVIELTAFDLADNEIVHTITIWVESRAIVMSPPEPGDGVFTNLTSVEVRARLSRMEGVTVKVNQALADLDLVNKSFSLSIDLIEGVNKLQVVAEDIYGHVTWANLTVTADWTPPILVVTSPLVVNTTEEWVEITGSVSSDGRLYIQGSPVLLWEGNFSVRYPVYVGETGIILRVVDDVGNGLEERLLVYRIEVDVQPDGPSPWEVVPFLLGVPIMMVAEYLVLRRRNQGGEFV
jgi:parallel beta-helix repeat protein